MNIVETILRYDNHKRGKDVDFSVSELSGRSNYQIWLAKQDTPKTYKNDLELQIPSKVGTGFHMIAEEALKDVPGVITEHYMEGTISGYKISGTPDVIYEDRNGAFIGDFKTKGTFQMKKALLDGVPEVIAQMSIYAYLYAQKYHTPMPILGEVYLIHVGDKGWWSKADCEKLSLPLKSKVPKYHTVEVVLWNAEEVEQFVLKRASINEEPEVDCQDWQCNYCEFDCTMRV